MNEVNKNIFDATYDDIAAYFGVKGRFVKEEYSDHMKANYRYYKWISAVIWQKMDNVSEKATANAYVAAGLRLTEQTDRFTHKTTSSRKIERSSSSGGSSRSESGGGSGRSGKF